LGGSKLWEELGRHYQKELWKIYDGRVPGFADLCCYWFEKARKQIESGKSTRAGLLATQGIRGGANREVLQRIKETGDIFFAVSSRDWGLPGAALDVSMIGFDDGSEKTRTLDDKTVVVIHPNLTANTADVTSAEPLKENARIAFSGTKKSGDFDVADELAREWLLAPNPNGKPNSDLLKPWLNGGAIVKRLPPAWIIDTGTDLKLNDFSLYEKSYAHAFKFVKPQRDENKREHRRLNWWLHAETCPGMRTAIIGQQRFLTTPRVSKFRIFSWADSMTLPDDGIYIFARSDDFFFGIVQSKFHEVWSLKLGTRLEDRPRYTPNTCFETFPFPRPTPAQQTAIAAAAKELNQLREGWLNPPEWTEIRPLEFPGTPGGVWARYIDPTTIKDVTLPGEHNIPEKERQKIKVGTVVYPRREPKDAKCAAELKKRTLTKLYNERPPWLDLAHKTLDAAVAAAYGWPSDLTDEQILEKLLALNLERAAVEARTSETQKRRTTREKHAGEMI
jgi:type II restriction/modification system DNA methylase subunit YeeA